VSSGIAKLMLIEQDVEFFGRYGLSNPMLIAFGFAQLLGGLLMIFAKTRFAGAAIVLVTFLVSLALLLVDGNIPVGVVTGFAILLLAVVMKQSLPKTSE
jgi:hypothetical protein